MAGQLHGLGAMSSETHSATREPRTVSDRSYSIRTDLDYRLVGMDSVLGRGHGQTKAMSRTSVWLESDKALRVGVPIELVLTWPVLLDNKIPLKLVIDGNTVRVDGKYARVEISRHEFRTRALSVGSGQLSRAPATTERTMTA
jgi:hypothetical protein